MQLPWNTEETKGKKWCIFPVNLLQTKLCIWQLLRNIEAEAQMPLFLQAWNGKAFYAV